jgi:hypothetical protein
MAKALGNGESVRVLSISIAENLRLRQSLSAMVLGESGKHLEFLRGNPIETQEAPEKHPSNAFEIFVSGAFARERCPKKVQWLVRRFAPTFRSSHSVSPL